ncbi:MAG: Phosphoesterase RecJ domain protein, partial [Candidatus Woesebacteria bacterium GW2011_GWB1_38_5b]
MTYSQPAQILEKIKSAQNILVNCHKSPDVDSISSALSMCQALVKMGKKVSVISPDAPLPELSFLPCFENIKVIDYANFDFKQYDLFVVLDSANNEVVTGSKTNMLPNMPTLVIDHHRQNTNFGEINLVDPERSATAELLYLLFQDWGITVDKDLSTTLLTGILGDTGAFEFHNTTPRTLQVAADLMLKGANKDELLVKIFRSRSIDLLKFWGYALDKMQLDPSGKFTWIAVPYSVFENLGKPQKASSVTSNLFSRMVDGTKFGIVMVEESPNFLKVSLRSREDFDVSKIATSLGGGGHEEASAVVIV